jgi:threonine synthase
LLSVSGADVDDPDFLPRARRVFTSFAAGDAAISVAVSHFKSTRQYVPCPHTGAGLHAALQHMADAGTVSASEPIIAMATAHPGKFGDTVVDVLGHDGKPMEPIVPDCLRHVLTAPKRCLACGNSVDAVRDIVSTVCGGATA